MTSLWCERALVGDRVRSGVLLDVEDGRFTSIEIGAEASAAHRLHGLTIPGMANAHSHAFHRVLRSRTQADRGSFWTWRDLMYRAAERLEPDSYRTLARAVFGEMVLAGFTCLGEFHYLHHQLDGTSYDDPNEMGNALLTAASEAGIRITLLDTLYLHGSLDADGHSPPTEGQRRFADDDADTWAQRVDLLAPTEGQKVGAAIHSIRAVDSTSMATASAWAAAHDAPIHAHVSEQVAENDASMSHYELTPIGVLSESGVLSHRFSAVHATHLTPADVAKLAESTSTVVMCPTTERDLGDGIGPTREFANAGISIAIGSDSHAIIDPFEEARAIELDERLRSRTRGTHSAKDLLSMAAANGHRSLGWHDAGEIAVGKRADLATISLDSVRVAGTSLESSMETAVFAATTSDITDVHIDGRHVVVDGHHVSLDVANELKTTITELMDGD